MKIRFTGALLAGMMAALLTLTAFASTGEETTPVLELPPVTELSPFLEMGAPEEQKTPFYLGGEPVDTLDYQLQNNIYYVTVESFVAALDKEAMVEEEAGEDGKMSLAVSAVTKVVDEANPYVVEYIYVEGEGFVPANVEEETLSLTAREGDFYVVANGRYLYVKDGVILVEGKVALPIRVLAKMFNLTVKYDGATKAVHLDRQEGERAYLAAADEYYDSDTLYWLSRIIHAESGNQSLAGKLAVGNVVMNRVADPAFPDTIYDVLFQRNQFSPASSGSIHRTPSQSSVVAAMLVLDGAEALEDVLFFNRAGLRTYASRNRTYVATIGAHAFYA